MGKKHKKHKERFKHQTTTQTKELSLKLSIPLTSLPKYAETSSSASKQSNESELSCKIQIQKAGLAFVIPKKKDTGQDIDTSLQGKKHKKKKHHHDNKPEPLHISKSHDSQSAYSDSSSQSAEKHSSPHCSASSSPLRKLSIVIPKLNSSSIPTSSPLLTYSPVQIPPVEVQADSDSEATKQDLSAVQTKQSSLAEITAKVPTHHQVTSSEQCSTSVTNDTSEELQKLRTNIKYALKTIHYQLEKKDPQGIFAEPVTDDIAPGYSALISNPMDFSTMAKKIDTLQYQSVDEYKDDFLLMCNNCMTYNPEDTVFYQTAKKLSSSGLKLIAKETVKKADLLSVPTVAAAIGSYSRSSTPLSFQAPLSKQSISPAPSSSREQLSVAPTTRSQSNSNSLMCRIPLSVLNRHSIRHPLPTSGSMTQELRLSTLNQSSLVSSVTDGITSSLSSTAQWVADTMSAAAEPPYDDTGLTKLRVGWTSDNSDESSDEEEYDNVLEQVQAAAAAVHEAAVNRKTVNLAYLDTSEAGRATLNILNPDGGDDVNVRNVDMTDLEALIAEGEEANKKLELEHSRHKTTPVAYLMYGPYGAFAPYFDSSFATLTRMDSSLLYSVYGDDMGVTYAHSLQRFVRGTSSFACEMAEAILNGLTSNKHRLLKEKLTEQRDKLFHMSQQQQQQQQQPQQPVQQQQQQPQQETRQPKQEGQEGQQPKQEEQQQQLEQGGQQQKQKEQEERKESQSDEKHSADQQITAGADMNEKDTMSTTTTVAITNITAATNPVTTTTTTATTGSVQQEKLAQPVLDKNVEILLQLQQLQNERLSRVPFTIPQSQEATTALHVAENLKQLTSKVTPGDVVSVQALQNAMGVTVTAANSVKSTVDSTTPYST